MRYYSLPSLKEVSSRNLGSDIKIQLKTLDFLRLSIRSFTKILSFCTLYMIKQDNNK